MNAPLRQVQEDAPETLAHLFGHDEFHRRHIGPSPEDEAAMLAAVGCASRAALVDQTIPPAIRLPQAGPAPGSGEPVTEAAALAELAGIAADNQAWRSYIGAGYHGTITPEPIRRNVLENPGWYTA
ncbi:MAG: glycine dehydrogenase (aminomethyl-transferring), partial [Burkholderiaceae bacterium]|nr:glycine dehydrogenase (aminomethyl-transferring) [Burkholderiaceae bacterium]